MSVLRVTLARLSSPPDTSRLERCSETESLDAIAAMSARVLRRRRDLAVCGVGGPVMERMLGALRRLQSPNLAVYRTASGLVLSEPFGAMPSVIEQAPIEDACLLVRKLLGKTPARALVASLASFGRTALERAIAGGIRATIVPSSRSFSQCSRSVASLAPDIDHWHAPPAGLFVLEERLLLLRPHALRMAAAHEFAHALDAVLAAQPRSYLSFESSDIREAFVSAPGYVNEYAASGLDEYFAESVRAYVEVNDDRSSWLPLTRHDLFLRDPRMFRIIERLFETRLRAKACTAKLG